MVQEGSRAKGPFHDSLKPSVLLLQEKFEVTNLDMKSGMTLKIKGKIHKDVNR